MFNPNTVNNPSFHSGQIIVINPITGNRIESGNPNYPMVPGKTWGVPATWGGPAMMATPQVFLGTYLTANIQEFTPVWQQAMEKTHRFNQDPKNDLAQVLAQLSPQDRKIAEEILTTNPAMVGLRASDAAGEKLQQTLVSLRLAQIRANQILTLKDVVPATKESGSMWVQSSAPQDFMIVVTDADGQDHKFKAVFFNREQNWWMAQNPFNQGFQSGPFQGPHSQFSQTQPRHWFGPHFGLRPDSETI